MNVSLRTREYWRQPNAEMHKQVRACLERTIRIVPDYADAGQPSP
jgi:ribulose bisphosphate carboxylase small subunit